MFQMILTCAVKQDLKVLFGSSPEARSRQHTEKTGALNVYWHEYKCGMGNMMFK